MSVGKGSIGRASKVMEEQIEDVAVKENSEKRIIEKELIRATGEKKYKVGEQLPIYLM